jgi:hypothetical protein
MLKRATTFNFIIKPLLFLYIVCAQHEQDTPIRKLEKNLKNTNKFFNSCRMMELLFPEGENPLNAGIKARKF